ncbi:hypothetical protein RN001_011372 [Aquatica leii]|uniref:Potassium channel domain-containing protein n=1 Tax=Aquatica leii TaxID=1421715 RepID=A0AAN7S8X7_9COLE|nr:hypothetical protein RN001_011372 [Aquatica leii]
MICDSNSPTSTVYPSLPPHSPYHRRSSPPGSPAPKKCCYEHKESYSPNENVFCCCYSCPGSQSTSVIATIGVCCLVLAYTILGAFAFMALEGRLEHDTAVAASKHDPKHDKSTVGVLRAQTVDKLWSITENLNILYRENWTRLAAEEVLEFQEALIRAMKGTNNGQVRNPSSAMFYYHTPHRWSFSSSFLYSLTLITTIGYGSISPKTTWGKLVTIIYAFIGIPLMLLYLSTTGDLLARNFRKLYGKLCGTSLKQQNCPCSKTVRVPLILCLIIILGYICLGAVLFHRLENWTILEGSYFCFTSLGTIGFGDLMPGQNTEDISLCTSSAYILVGMALVAMCFSLVQDQVVSLFRYIGATCAKNEAIKIREEVQMAVVGS